MLSREQFEAIVPLTCAVVPLSRHEANQLLAHEADQSARITELEDEREDATKILQKFLEGDGFSYSNRLVARAMAVGLLLTDARKGIAAVNGHLRAAREVIKETICHRCRNRVGFVGPCTPGDRTEGYLDWRTCTTCAALRATLGAIDAASPLRNDDDEGQH